MQIARFSYSVSMKKCDVLHMPSQAAFGGARETSARPSADCAFAV